MNTEYARWKKSWVKSMAWKKSQNLFCCLETSKLDVFLFCFLEIITWNGHKIFILHCKRKKKIVILFNNVRDVSIVADELACRSARSRAHRFASTFTSFVHMYRQVSLSASRELLQQTSHSASRLPRSALSAWSFGGAFFFPNIKAR